MKTHIKKLDPQSKISILLRVERSVRILDVSCSTPKGDSKKKKLRY